MGCRQLDIWTGELGLPKVTTLGYLFSPQSFLTAVMQASTYAHARACEGKHQKREGMAGKAADESECNCGAAV